MCSEIEVANPDRLPIFAVDQLGWLGCFGVWRGPRTRSFDQGASIDGADGGSPA
jgi:hypothetical protein